MVPSRQTTAPPFHKGKEFLIYALFCGCRKGDEILRGSQGRAPTNERENYTTQSKLHSQNIIPITKQQYQWDFMCKS